MNFDNFYKIEELIIIKTEQLIFPIVVRSNYLTSIGIKMCAKHLLHFSAGFLVSLFSFLALSSINCFNSNNNLLISLLLGLLVGFIKEIIDYFSKNGDPKWYGAFMTFLGGLVFIIIIFLWR